MVKSRRGFSFIELLVSIVVIGIVFMSVPLILMETERSSAFSTQQEGIMAGVTSLVNILGYRWDETDTNQTLNGGFAKVCDVTQGAADLNRTSGTSNRRKGHFKGEYRRKFFDYTYLNDPTVSTFATLPASLGADSDDGGLADDIDDFSNSSTTLTGGGIRDYKFDYTIGTKVYYVTDNFGYDVNTTLNADISNTNINQMTNIKMIETTVTSDEGVIKLYAFSSNIGEYKILHRTFE
ncbi:type II secretion system protein [Hydrogenimonas urashimensis]|uniref:type II secretion system protein n=1 Tax=Hydrogenimonas urashimensis TaxID=2740515 RepID=UPI00191551BE|nr:prepilin-type N-terminal cleavage/methylation domain-containing protein [Hydrogenimonas urashimensis]